MQGRVTLASALGALLLLGGVVAVGQEPAAPPPLPRMPDAVPAPNVLPDDGPPIQPPGAIVPVQGGGLPDIAPTAPTGTTPAAPQSVDPLGGAVSNPAGKIGAAVAPAATAPEAQQRPVADAGATSVTGAGGVAGAALNAPDAGELLSKSAGGVGVEIQRRNAIVADPRVRGWRAGQYLTVADGGLFTPARADLDTAVSKYEPGSIRDIIVVKGPYSALYGPGFSFLDIATIDSPRYRCFEWHGRTALGYQSNGDRWDALQGVSVGDRDWGFRASYNFLQGNDYRAGDGTRVPASYLSHNVSYALGFDLTDKSKIEFKGFNVIQSGLEFPGLYFDIDRSDAIGMSTRYSVRDQGFFDKFTLDFWYNNTTSSGDTTGFAKQSFVQKLLAVSFNPQLFPVGPDGRPIADRSVASLRGTGAVLFDDFSTTRFTGRSLGYRALVSWGPEADPYLTLGTDLNLFGQGLVENIVLRQTQGLNVNTGTALPPGGATFNQVQRIPDADSVNPGLLFQLAIPVTQRLKARAGGRVDWVHTSSGARTIDGNLNLFGTPPVPGQPPQRTLDPLAYSTDPGNPNLDREFGLVAGFLRGEYKLDDDWTLLAGVGHAQRPPTLTELYAAGPFIGVLQQGTSRLIGDPRLSPEKLTQLDLGVTGDYDFFQVGVTGFYAWVDDYITFDANRSGLGLTQVVFTNTDRATLAGAELFTAMDWTAWLSTFGTLSYTQGIDQTATDRRRPANLDSSRRDDPLTLRRKSRTEPLPQIPPLESRMGIRFHAPSRTPKWQIEFSARVVADQNNVATSLGEFRTPGFTVFNVRGFWQATEQLLVTAGVENFGDRTYREHLDPISGNLLNAGPLLRPGANFFFNTQFTY